MCAAIVAVSIVSSCTVSTNDRLPTQATQGRGGAAQPGASGTFNSKAYDLFVPAEIGPGGGPECGFPADWKLALRLDPVTETSSGVWTFNGCIASPGNVFYDVTLALNFPDGQQLAFLLLDETDPKGEATFVVEVRRASVVGAKATVYFNQLRK